MVKGNFQKLASTFFRILKLVSEQNVIGVIKKYKQGDRMRDPKRIQRILKTVEAIWTKHPDLRLCQLLGNCYPAGDNYYREDDSLEQKLIETYEWIY